MIAGLLDDVEDVEYRFAIDGKFLRGSLKSHLAAHKIDTEKVVIIKYDISPMKPKLAKSQDQEDWIMSVLPDEGGRFVVALANGSVSLFSSDYKLIGKSDLNQNETVKCAQLIDM